MDLIQVPMGCRLGHELPDTLVQRTVEQQIRAGALGAPLIVEGRPFPKSSRRIEIDVIGAAWARVLVGHFSLAFRPLMLSRPPLHEGLTPRGFPTCTPAPE